MSDMFQKGKFDEKYVLHTSEKWRLALKTEHAHSVLHCVLHLFLNSKQWTKLETENSDSMYFRSSLFRQWIIGIKQSGLAASA